MIPTGVNINIATCRIVHIGLTLYHREAREGAKEPERAQTANMDKIGKKYLRRLVTGLYRDTKGTLYLYIYEFLRKHGMPDSPEVRAAVLQQIREEFGGIKIVVVENNDEDPDAARTTMPLQGVLTSTYRAGTPLTRA
jgi:hypothetical protein